MLPDDFKTSVFDRREGTVSSRLCKVFLVLAIYRTYTGDASLCFTAEFLTTMGGVTNKACILLWQHI